jgi:hypothetical protein
VCTYNGLHVLQLTPLNTPQIKNVLKELRAEAGIAEEEEEEVGDEAEEEAPPAQNNKQGMHCLVYHE